MNDVDDKWNKIIESGNKIIQILGEMVNQREQAAKLSTHTPEPSRQPPSIVITTSPLILPTEDPEDSLIIGNEELNTIPEKKSNEFIKSSVEGLVLIPSESEDTSGSDSECILPSCDDFSPIDIPEEKAMTFSNPLFNSNDDFISSGDESLSDEDISKDNVKIYSNPLFEFDDNDDTTPNLPPKVFLDRDLRSLSDAPIDDLMSEDKIIDLGISSCVANATPWSISALSWAFLTGVVMVVMAGDALVVLLVGAVFFKS
nr:hypothetical protein [Tanacetum cinerariifolium]